MTFKDGDVLFCRGSFEWVFIYKKGLNRTNCYVAVGKEGDFYFDNFVVKDCKEKELRLATEEEKQKLINALRASKEPKAKAYLKRFFPNHSNSASTGKDCEFKFRDLVLVRSSDEDKRCAAEFSNKDGKWYAVLGGLYYEHCIPYNEQTAHLLGTTKNPE